MAKLQHNDTIAAIATPIGEGAIAVIRVSGPDAIAILDEAFIGTSKLSSAKGYTVHLGRICDEHGSEVDEVLCTVFRNPNSYTGEDCVEVGCHGGLFVTRKVLEAILSRGARMSEPGEFTKRSFLNGKMDLSQAEAVADLISAKTAAMHKASLHQLEGRFSAQIRKLRSEILNISSLVELGLDFSEEGIEVVSKTELLGRIDLIRNQIKSMVDSYRLGILYREGVSVAIVGRPNVGKSSLFNALLNSNRAIVTEIPGTTRDLLQESISIDGLLFRLTDTAGLRPTVDIVEREGVVRAKGVASEADVLVLVDDASSGPDRERAISFLTEVELPKAILIAYNKMDLCGEVKFTPKKFSIRESSLSEIMISAKNGRGLSELRNELRSLVIGEGVEINPVQVLCSRHHSSLQHSLRFLDVAGNEIAAGTSGEFVALDIKSAADSLNQIIGEISNDEALNNIFKHFCIGK